MLADIWEHIEPHVKRAPHQHRPSLQKPTTTTTTTAAAATKHLEFARHQLNKKGEPVRRPVGVVVL